MLPIYIDTCERCQFYIMVLFMGYVRGVCGLVLLEQEKSTDSKMPCEKFKRRTEEG